MEDSTRRKISSTDSKKLLSSLAFHYSVVPTKIGGGSE